MLFVQRWPVDYVDLCQGDLLLCDACEQFHFPYISRALKSGNKTGRSTSKNCCSADDFGSKHDVFVQCQQVKVCVFVLEVLGIIHVSNVGGIVLIMLSSGYIWVT